MSQRKNKISRFLSKLKYNRFPLIMISIAVLTIGVIAEKAFPTINTQKGILISVTSHFDESAVQEYHTALISLGNDVYQEVNVLSTFKKDIGARVTITYNIGYITGVVYKVKVE